MNKLYNLETNNLKVSGLVDFNGPVIFYDNVSMQKNLIVSGEATFEDNVYFKKNVDIEQDLYVSGNTYISGDTAINGDTTINENLYVSGNTYISGDTYIKETLTVEKEIFANSGIESNGAITIHNNTLTIVNGLGDTIFQIDPDLGGDLYVEKNAYISGNLEIKNQSTFYETPILPLIDQTGSGLTIDTIKSLPSQTAVNMEIVKQVISHYETLISGLRDEILNPAAPTGIVYVDNRADINGKQAITSAKEVPTPSL
jgi:NDP-sugar pyrophosphorylase family protein